jgi:hypothetical protein
VVHLLCDEGAHVSLHTVLSVQLFRAFDVTIAGLVNHVWTLRGIDHCERRGKHNVQASGPLTSAKHENAHRPRPVGESLARCSDARDLAAYWVAYTLRFNARRETRGKCFEHTAGKSRQHAIRHTGDRVLLVQRLMDRVSALA